MPRKFDHSIDYEDYDYYEDHDDDHYTDEKDDISIQTNQSCAKKGLWRCSICTFDNDDNLMACDICGVLRKPLPIDDTRRQKNLVAPFKFEVPSPDDMVTSGMRTKLGLQGTTSIHHASHTSARNVVKFPSDVVEEVGRSSAMIASENGDDTMDSSSKQVANKYIAQRNTVGVEKLALSQQMIRKGVSDSVRASEDCLTDIDTPKSLNGGFKSLPLSSTPRAEYRPEKWMSPLKSEDELMQLNLVIVGHVDSGKSSLSGRLLHLLGRISQKEMHKYEREAKMQGKVSFRYAWALDESSEERERGITMTVAVAYFDTKKYHVVLLDSPGHKDFVPNMISGAAQADVAILVVDASLGSFESGMDATMGQTREHARLVRSSGVDQIIVAVNKMDSIGYSQERFNMIKGQLGSFLRSCGLKDSSLFWIPVSVMENQNLVCASDVHLLSWYHGPYLLDAIDSLQSPEREFFKPPVIPVSDVIKLHSTGMVSACGKLEVGALQSGSKVLVMPSGLLGTVHSLERDSKVCAVGRAGDNVAISIQGIDGSQIRSGDVLCHPDYPVSTGRKLELKVLIFEIDTPILIGSQLEFQVHHAKGAVSVTKLIAVFDSKSGSVSKKSPRCLFSKQSAALEIVLQSSVCVEEFSKCRALGRVYLRTSGSTAAVGVITRIVE